MSSGPDPGCHYTLTSMPSMQPRPRVPDSGAPSSQDPRLTVLRRIMHVASLPWNRNDYPLGTLSAGGVIRFLRSVTVDAASSC